MLSSERKIYILNQLEEFGVVKMKNICEQLDVSESSIRRDLEELEQQNQLKRVHGGAMKLTLGVTLTNNRELTMQSKTQLHVEAKRAICKKAAALVEDGDCIFVDGGTTLMFLPMYLEGKRVKIVSHNNFLEVGQTSTIELIRVGGNYRSNYNMNIGSIALETISLFNFDYAFIGCAGIDVAKKVAYTAEMESAQVKQVAMKQALKSYLLIDETKLDTRGFYKFASVDDFNLILMDSYPSKKKKPEYIELAD